MYKTTTVYDQQKEALQIYVPYCCQNCVPRYPVSKYTSRYRYRTLAEPGPVGELVSTKKYRKQIKKLTSIYNH